MYGWHQWVFHWSISVRTFVTRVWHGAAACSIFRVVVSRSIFSYARPAVCSIFSDAFPLRTVPFVWRHLCFKKLFLFFHCFDYAYYDRFFLGGLQLLRYTYTSAGFVFLFSDGDMRGGGGHVGHTLRAL